MGKLRELLEADHLRLEGLLAAAAANPECFDHASFEAFRSGLLRHIGIEEKILFAYARQRQLAAPLPELKGLRSEHGALAALLVPTPDQALVREIRSILERHNRVEEGLDGVYAAVESLAGRDLPALLARVREAPPVRLAPHRDGPRVVRTADEALRLQNENS
jgi:hypothetical protein